MKGINTVYYLLFVLLIMGAFASMAQNNYGLGILGGVAIAFALVFLYQLFSPGPEGRSAEKRVELIALCALAALIAFRQFGFSNSFADSVFIFFTAVLVLIYGRLLINIIRAKKAGQPLPYLVALFYLVAILFLLSLGFSTLIPELTGIIGLTALVLLLTWIGVAWISRKTLVNGERVSIPALLHRSGSQVIIVVVFFFLSGLYISFNRLGVLPQMYTDRLPRAYFELVREAESGKDKRIDGKFKYQRFKEAYSGFLTETGNRKNK